jgi:hypothetical protein
MTITAYQQSPDISKTVDLMWFDVTERSYADNNEVAKGVPVVFKHLLSWLTFKFQKKSADTKSVIARDRETIRERTLHHLGERGRGGGGRVSGAGFGKSNLTRQISVSGHNRLLDAAMLISEKYLEVEHILAHALEAEVTRLDNPRMDGSYSDLMSGGTLQRHHLFGIHVSPKRVELRTGFFNG